MFIGSQVTYQFCCLEWYARLGETLLAHVINALHDARSDITLVSG
jgi:hypothetical protein